MVLTLARTAGVRSSVVDRVLAGLEVWPSTYMAVRHAAEVQGVTDFPPLAPRAPRKREPALGQPCAECASLRARVAELEAHLAAAGVGRVTDGKVPVRMQASSPPKRLRIIGPDDQEIAK